MGTTSEPPNSPVFTLTPTVSRLFGSSNRSSTSPSFVAVSRDTTALPFNSENFIIISLVPPASPFAALRAKGYFMPRSPGGLLHAQDLDPVQPERPLLFPQ